jgi:superfamily II DNA or RNA helicase
MKGIDSATSAELALVENMPRAHLNPTDEARGCAPRTSRAEPCAARYALRRTDWQSVVCACAPTVMMQPIEADTRKVPNAGDRLLVDGDSVIVRMAQPDGDRGIQIAIEGPAGVRLIAMSWSEFAAARGQSEDGRGASLQAVTALWAHWMRWVSPRLRSAVLATAPLQPYAHQDEAVSGHMLNQPRLRLLLGDEPGTGKTIMTGMYLADARRLGLVMGGSLIVVPAHLVTKWLLDLERYFAIRAQKVTAEVGRSPLPLREDVDTWVVSLDLYTYNPDVRRKLGAGHASWSLAVFDEAHRLTPTSQYLSAARDVADRSHHLLLLTATPHRGKEHFFRALFNLLEPDLYPWSIGDGEKHRPLRPSSLHYLRRMKETLRDHDGELLFPPRSAEAKLVSLTGLEEDVYGDVMAYVDKWYSDQSTLARSIYGKRAASSLHAAHETLNRRREALTGGSRPAREAHIPRGYDDADFERANLEDLDDWADAERAIVQASSRDRRAEVQHVDAVLAKLRSVLDNYTPAPSKWAKALELLAQHEIAPGHGQALVFTEFTDTARWLHERFSSAGFSVEVLEGGLGPEQRDDLQRRFMSGTFQVLVSTDAGGEGIDPAIGAHHARLGHPMVAGPARAAHGPPAPHRPAARRLHLSPSRAGDARRSRSGGHASKLHARRACAEGPNLRLDGRCSVRGRFQLRTRARRCPASGVRRRGGSRWRSEQRAAAACRGACGRRSGPQRRTCSRLGGGAGAASRGSHRSHQPRDG